MILAKEINALGTKNKLKDTQIEKDYLLSWVLYGISRNATLRKALAFKGGTVLKKAYFQDYRWSEDLDFTLLDDSLSDERILAEFEDVYEWIKDEANITVQFKELNVHTSGSIAFYVNYIGPLQANIASRDLKIDITRGEILLFPLEHRKIFILYSDLPKSAFEMQCYSLSEVLIEKMTALIGRTEPRDLYDFWYLTEYERLNARQHLHEFERKAKNKNHNPTLFESKVLGKERNLKQGWLRKLENQVYDLPDFDSVFRESKRNFKIYQ